MNTIKTLVMLLLVVTITSCSKDDDSTSHTLTLDDAVLNVSENLTSDLLTTILATDSNTEHELTYSIVSQTPANSVMISETTGDLFVANASAFDYEQNTIITVVLEVTDGTLTAQATLTINILDVQENG
ncbi:MAG: cadherin repeat domain-containing protein [Flavobacteriaceae bacterium]